MFSDIKEQSTLSHWDVLLFQLLPIIIPWLHMVVSIIMALLNIVSNSTTWKYRCMQTLIMCSKWRGAQGKNSMNTF